MDALLVGLTDNQILSPVTLGQLFTQVPAGGNREPAVRQLQAGAADRGITAPRPTASPSTGSSCRRSAWPSAGTPPR